MKVIDRYRIEYINGVIQEKNLISHDDYLNIIIPMQDKINKLASSKENKKENQIKISELKQKLKMLFGEYWFTDKSPLFGAIRWSVLTLPAIQGGTSYCQLNKIELK